MHSELLRMLAPIRLEGSQTAGGSTELLQADAHRSAPFAITFLLDALGRGVIGQIAIGGGLRWWGQHGRQSEDEEQDCRPEKKPFLRGSFVLWRTA